MIHPVGALLIGLCAGFVSVYGYVKITPLLEKKFGLHDTCGVNNLHGIPGIMGGLFGAIAILTGGTSKVYKMELLRAR